MKTKVIRVYLKSLRNFRKHLPGIRGETAANYFDRLQVYLDKINQETEELLL